MNKNTTFIDTNVIMRYLLDDIPEQALIAEHIIDGGAWTTPEVLAEITYVLDCIYEAPREDIAAALEIIASLVELRPEAETLTAIQEFKATKLDFADCMASAYMIHGEKVFTFDRKLNARMSENKR